MYDLKSIFFWLLISIFAANAFASLTEFHCKPKQGCQISQCDPIPPGWFDKDISKYLKTKEFPILCKSEDEGNKKANSESTDGGILGNIEEDALVQKISEVVDKKMISILDRLETMENRVWDLMQLLLQQNLFPAAPTVSTKKETTSTNSKDLMQLLLQQNPFPATPTVSTIKTTTTTITISHNTDASNNPSLCNGLACSSNGKCVMQFGGGYACECNDGYTGDGYNCKERHDATESSFRKLMAPIIYSVFPTRSMTTTTDASSQHNDANNNKSPCSVNKCSHNAECLPLENGMYTCECNDGYMGDGFSCTKNPISTKSSLWSLTQLLQENAYEIPIPCDFNICSLKATCIPQSDGSYNCQCIDGYSGDGFNCEVIKPCDRSPCHANATCTNVDFVRFRCKCKSGFIGNGKKCEVIRPCERSPCHANATCTNVDFDSYRCKCKSGFIGDGMKICKGVCSNCHLNAYCMMLSSGKSKCKCKSGYQGNGRTCKKRARGYQYQPKNSK